MSPRSDPDGYTLLFSTITQIAIAPFTNKIAYDPIKDFKPVSIVATSPFVLTTDANFPAKTLPEFISYVKAHPAQFTYGTAGAGSLSHISAAVFLKRAGLDMTMVPYRGLAPAFDDLLGGSVQLVSATPVELQPFMQADKVRLLASSGATRSASLPDVPTISETIPGHEVITWNGVLVPAQTPQIVIDTLAREILAAEKDSEFTGRLARMGVDPASVTPEQFQKRIAADMDYWRKVVPEMGLQTAVTVRRNYRCSSPMSKARRVIIVGAGPAGIVCALALSKHGIPVTVFEQEPAPVKDQRAASIHPPTLAMLDEIGVTSRIIDKGFVSSKYRYHDRLDGSVVAEFDLDQMRDEFQFPFVLQYEQYKLTAAIHEEYANGSGFDIRFSHKVLSLSQDGTGITVEVSSPAGLESHRADFVIGCDGGRSTVRKLANIDFKGFRYPEKFIKIATTFDFAQVNPDLVFRNYFSDPEEWCNLFKVRGEREPGLWRAIFPMRPDEEEETALQADVIEERLQRFFPKPGRYEIEYVSVYGVAQCVAETFRKGRILLAGDSAHVNNPIGGMGMNGGIHDAVESGGETRCGITRQRRRRRARPL